MFQRCQLSLSLKAVSCEIKKCLTSLSRSTPARTCLLRRQRSGALRGCTGSCQGTRPLVTSVTPSPFAQNTPPSASSSGTAAPSPPAAAGSQDAVAMSRLSVNRNSSVTSSWETVPNWCELCSEPVNSWHQHVGKREHICLEETLRALAAHPRSWNAREVWMHSELFREHYARRPPGQPRTPSANVRRLLRSGMYVPAVDSPMNIFYETLDKDDPVARRQEILVLLLHLRDKGMLTLTPDRLSYAVLQGQAVLNKEMLPILAGVFPASEVRVFSAMLSMICSPFNAETVYYLCGLEALTTPELVQSYLCRGLGQPSSSSPLSSSRSKGDFEDDVHSESLSEGDMVSAEDADDIGNTDDGGVPVFLRRSLPRVLLGSLRWSLEPESTQPPPALYQQEARYGHYTTLAARASRLLMAEMVFARVSEYVARVESVLRSERGLEMLRQHGGLRDAKTDARKGGLSTSQLRTLYDVRLPPQLSNYGAVEMSGGAGLCTANVLGAPAAEKAIQALEVQRITRLRSRRRGRASTTAVKQMARTVRTM